MEVNKGQLLPYIYIYICVFFQFPLSCNAWSTKNKSLLKRYVHPHRTLLMKCAWWSCFHECLLIRNTECQPMSLCLPRLRLNTVRVAPDGPSWHRVTSCTGNEWPGSPVSIAISKRKPPSSPLPKKESLGRCMSKSRTAHFHPFSRSSPPVQCQSHPAPASVPMGSPGQDCPKMAWSNGYMVCTSGLQRWTASSHEWREWLVFADLKVPGTAISHCGLPAHSTTNQAWCPWQNMMFAQCQSLMTKSWLIHKGGYPLMNFKKWIIT